MLPQSQPLLSQLLVFNWTQAWFAFACGYISKRRASWEACCVRPVSVMASSNMARATGRGVEASSSSAEWRRIHLSSLLRSLIAHFSLHLSVPLSLSLWARTCVSTLYCLPPDQLNLTQWTKMDSYLDHRLEVMQWLSQNWDGTCGSCNGPNSQESTHTHTGLGHLSMAGHITSTRTEPGAYISTHRLESSILRSRNCNNAFRVHHLND